MFKLYYSFYCELHDLYSIEETKHIKNKVKEMINQKNEK